MSDHHRSVTEEQCLAELASTEVSPRTARVMSWLFVVLIAGVLFLKSRLIRKWSQETQELPS